MFNLAAQRSRRSAVNANVARRLNETRPNDDFFVVVAVVVVAVVVVVVVVIVVVVAHVFVPVPVVTPVQAFCHRHLQTHVRNKSVLLDPPPSALNITLPAFAAEHPALSRRSAANPPAAVATVCR